VVREVDPCLLASCSSAVYCELEQPKVGGLVMVLFVFVSVYFLHLFSDHAAVFSKIKLMNRKLCTSWFITCGKTQVDMMRISNVFWPLSRTGMSLNESRSFYPCQKCVFWGIALNTLL